MPEHDTHQRQEKRGLPSWIKVAISLAILAAVAVALAIYFTQDLVKTADGQLSALRDKDFSRAYYEYTAKDFKTATSLEAFSEFIKSHPALARNMRAHFNERSIENNIGTLNGTLISLEGGVTPVEYKFVKEAERWKILSMRLLASGALTSGTVVSRGAELVEPVEGQLAALRSNDIAKAYFGYTSKDFQETTPLKSFKEFVKNYPVLTRHQSTTFNEAKIDGTQGTIEAVVHGDELTTTVEYKLANEDGRWKVWSMRLNLPADHTTRGASPTESDALQEPIEAFLAYLRAGDLSKAYHEDTSREFQSATSLDAFREFVKAYPALAGHKGVTFKEPSVNHEAGSITTVLDSPNGATVIEYQLIKSPKGRWKIWSMQVLTKPSSALAPSAFNTSDLINAIEAQLAALRAGDLSRAYYAYTAKEFQRSTPLGTFEKFVQAHPALAENSVANFTNLAFKNDIGTFQGQLSSQQGEVNKAEFDLIYEGGKWCILSIQLYPPEGNQSFNPQKVTALNTDLGGAPSKRGDANKPPKAERYPSRPLKKANGAEITQILIGSETDHQGRVKASRAVFSPTPADFHVDVVVSNGQTGDKANLILEHLETKTRVPPVETVLDRDGDAVLSFVFTPPSQGWPRGNYRLIARTANGDEMTQQFRVQ